MVAEPVKKSAFHEFMDGIFSDYYGLKPGDPDPKELAAVRAAYRRYGRSGRDIIDMARGDPKKAREGVEAIGARMESWGMAWTLDTVAQWYLDWSVDPVGFENETTAKRRK